MIWAAVIGLVLAISVLFLIDAVLIKPNVSSIYELNRRKKAGDKVAAKLLLRETQLANLLSLQRLVGSILLVIIFALSVVSFGWVWGGVGSLCIVLIRDWAARVPFLRRRANALFHKAEDNIVTIISTHGLLRRLLHNATFTNLTQRNSAVASKEEFIHVAKESPGLLNKQEEVFLQQSLRFFNMGISGHMVPTEEIQVIQKGELLGPLVLDDLHKKGYSQFPVIDKDIDHIIGILQVKNSLMLDTTKKHTAKVETAMNPQVFYIEQGKALSDALDAFLGNQCFMLIVINKRHETVGIITLADVMKVFFGREAGVSVAT